MHKLKASTDTWCFSNLLFLSKPAFFSLKVHVDFFILQTFQVYLESVLYFQIITKIRLNNNLTI